MNGWSWFWTAWFAVSFAAFLIPEIWALVTGHPENTLSAQIWRLESLKAGQHVWQWTAAHWLIGGVLAVVLIWLLFHFVAGIWA